MEQHPVPQHIAAFKFKLFGNLTARQFFTLIVPLSLAALIFFSNLPVIIRFPLSFVIGIFAFVIALVPINGQPFDKWIVCFIKAVMSPTQRVWIKEKKIPDFLTVITAPPILEEQIPEELTSQKKEKLMAYLKTLPTDAAKPLDIKEQIAIGDIDFLREEIIPAHIQVAHIQETKKIKSEQPPIIWPAAWPTSTTSAQSTSYTEKISIEPEKPLIWPQAALTQTFKPRVAPHAKPYILPGIEKRLPQAKPQKEEYIELIKTPTVNLASDTNYSIDNIIPIRTPNNQIILVHGIGRTRARKLHFAMPENFDLSKLPIRGEKRFEISDELKRRLSLEDAAPPVVLPIKKTPQFPQIDRPQIQVPKFIPQKPKAPPQPSGQQVLSNRNTQSSIQTPHFSVTDLKRQTLSNKPLSAAEIVPLTKTPNVVSGQISDVIGAPIASAVLIIRDSNGIPIRALKTNKLGQFLSATPLSNGAYSVEIESDLANFKPLTINLKGAIVPPIAISAEGEIYGPNPN